MFARRLSRIFRGDGRALIVAFDHGLTEGPAKGMENPARALAASPAAPMIQTVMRRRRFVQELPPDDLAVTAHHDARRTPGGQFFSVEDALRPARMR